MIVTAYGLFWQVDEIDWHPGKGAKGKFRLLGRIGKYLPSRRVADFREQRGLYILYGNYGPHYAGLVRKQDMGDRLKQHLSDEHEGMWDRFSWFGFCSVLKGKDNGLQRLGKLALAKQLNPEHIIKDFEALITKGMDLRNVHQSHFQNAEEWVQIKRDEWAKYGVSNSESK